MLRPLIGVPDELLRAKGHLNHRRLRLAPPPEIATAPAASTTNRTFALYRKKAAIGSKRAALRAKRHCIQFCGSLCVKQPAAMACANVPGSLCPLHRTPSPSNIAQGPLLCNHGPIKTSAITRSLLRAADAGAMIRLRGCVADSILSHQGPKVYAKRSTNFRSPMWFSIS